MHVADRLVLKAWGRARWPVEMGKEVGAPVPEAPLPHLGAP